MERLSDEEMPARNIEEARRQGRAQDVVRLERKGAPRELAEYLVSLEARLNMLELSSLEARPPGVNAAG